MTIVLPDGWPRPSGYSNAVVREGRIVAVAGQVGWDPHSQAIASDDFVAQTRQALTNVVTVLRAAGAEPADVVRMTWYVTDRDGYLRRTREIGSVYREIFGRHYPAMSVVVVAGLIEPRAVVEIEATAMLPDVNRPSRDP